MPDFIVKIQTQADLAAITATGLALVEVAGQTKELAQAAVEAAAADTTATQKKAVNMERVQQLLLEASRLQERAAAKAAADDERAAAASAKLAAEAARVPTDPLLASAQAASRFVESATAAERAQRAFNRALGEASPAALATTAGDLRKLIAEEEAAGRSTAALREQLRRVLAEPFERAEQGLKKIGTEANHATGELAAMEHEAEHLLGALKQGVGIDLGHRLVESIAEIPALFREALAEGVHFNAQMESLTISLASAFRAAEPGKFLNFGEARRAGEEALEGIRVKANALGLDVHSLGETLAINLPTLIEGGISEAAQQLEVVTRLTQVAASKGLSGAQAMRDIIDELQGRGSRTIFGKELEAFGLTDESIKRAKEAGTLAQEILSKTAAYGEAAAASANTYSAAQQRLKNETEQLYGEISKPVFEALKSAMQELAKEIDKPEVREGLRSLGFEVAEIVKGGAALASWAVENAPLLVHIGEVAGVAALAFAAYKLARVGIGIGSLVLGLTAETSKLEIETLELDRNTLALERNAAARRLPGAGGAGGGLPGVGAESAGGAAAAEGAAAGGAGTVLVGLALVEAPLVGAVVALEVLKARQAEATASAEAYVSATEKSVAALTKQVGLTTTAAAQEDLRETLQEKASRIAQEIADAEERRAQAERDAAGAAVARAGGEGVPDFSGAAFDPAADQEREAHLERLRASLAAAEATLRDFDSLAGQAARDAAEDAVNKVDGAVARAEITENASARHQLLEAEASGDESAVEAAKNRLALEKEIASLRKDPENKLVPDDVLQVRAQKNVDLEAKAKDQVAADKELATVEKLLEKQKSAVELEDDLNAKLAELGQTDLSAAVAAVEAMARGTDEEKDARAKAIALLHEAVTLDKERESAQKKLDAEAKKTAADAEREQKKKEREQEQADREAERLAEQQAKFNETRRQALLDNAEDLAILRAKASGQTALATSLEAERDLRREITSLEREGLTYEEASASAQERKRLARKPGDVIDGTAKDTDAGGGLHTGGGLDDHRVYTPTRISAADRGRKGSDDLLAALRQGQNYNPSAEGDTLDQSVFPASLPFNGTGPLPAFGGPVPDLVPRDTAAAGLSPAGSRAANGADGADGRSGPQGPPGEDGQTPDLSPVVEAAEKTAGSAKETATSAKAAAKNTKDLPEAVGKLVSALNNLRKDLDAAEVEIQNVANDVYDVKQRVSNLEEGL